MITTSVRDEASYPNLETRDGTPTMKRRCLLICLSFFMITVLAVQGQAAKPNVLFIVVFPQLLKQHGWHTAAFGKIFHLGGGRSAEARARFVDLRTSWHEARDFAEWSDGERELYDHDADPEETKNVADQYADVAARFRERLETKRSGPLPE